MTVASNASTSATRFDSDRLITLGMAAAVALPLLCFVIIPLFGILKLSFVAPDGIGFDNYVRYFHDPKFAKVVLNSFTVALTTTVITVVLAYGFAYAMRRSAM